MKIYRQTVENHYLYTTNVFTSIEYRPTPPYGLLEELEKTNQPQGYLDYHNNMIVWFPDGIVQIYAQDGSRKIFWPKPTIQDAILYKGKGFWQFHSGGVITVKACGINYIFWPDEDTFEYYCPFYKMIFENDCYILPQDAVYKDPIYEGDENFPKKIETDPPSKLPVNNEDD